MKTRGQMKIMQMSFMILGVFLFFVLVGLFFLAITLKDFRNDAGELAREQAISSIEIIAGMSELNYDPQDSMVLDKDKLRVLAGGLGEDYAELWPVASIEAFKVYPAFSEKIECPGSGCNYYNIYSDSNQDDIEKFSAYVSICERVREFGSVYDKCEIGKLSVGVEIR